MIEALRVVQIFAVVGIVLFWLASLPWRKMLCRHKNASGEQYVLHGVCWWDFKCHDCGHFTRGIRKALPHRWPLIIEWNDGFKTERLP